jgi:DNA-binding NtrC family response regulator
VFSVNAPPLREMGTDRLLLLNHFRNYYAAQTTSQPFSLATEAQQRWLEYCFPGNVRELRNIVIRLIAKHPGEMVDATQLEAEFDTAAQPASLRTDGEADDLHVLALKELQVNPNFNLDDTLRRWERAYIEAAQQLAQGNVSQTARLLGIHRTTLYNRMEVLTRGRTGSPLDK